MDLVVTGFGGWTNEIPHGPCAVEEDAEALDTESEGGTVVSSSLRVLAEMKDSSTFCLTAGSGPWCSCAWLTQLRSYQHVADVVVAFSCDQWWLPEDRW